MNRVAKISIGAFDRNSNYIIFLQIIQNFKYLLIVSVDELANF